VGAAIDIDMLYEEGARGPHTPVVRNVRVERLDVAQAEYALRVRGLPGSPVRGLFLADSSFRGVKKGPLLADLQDLVLRNVSMEPRP
jgi:hypothetical protein